MVVETTTVNDCIVSDTALVSYYGLRFLVCAMDYCPVLDIDFVPDTNAIDIAPDNRIKPDTALIANNDVTNDCCIFGTKQFAPTFGCMLLTGKIKGI
jgi:hypothetical protein